MTLYVYRAYTKWRFKLKKNDISQNGLFTVKDILAISTASDIRVIIKCAKKYIDELCKLHKPLRYSNIIFATTKSPLDDVFLWKINKIYHGPNYSDRRKYNEIPIDLYTRITNEQYMNMKINNNRLRFFRGTHTVLKGLKWKKNNFIFKTINSIYYKTGPCKKKKSFRRWLKKNNALELFCTTTDHIALDSDCILLTSQKNVDSIKNCFRCISEEEDIFILSRQDWISKMHKCHLPVPPLFIEIVHNEHNKDVVEKCNIKEDNLLKLWEIVFGNMVKVHVKNQALFENMLLQKDIIKAIQWADGTIAIMNGRQIIKIKVTEFMISHIKSKNVREGFIKSIANFFMLR